MPVTVEIAVAIGATGAAGSRAGVDFAAAGTGAGTLAAAKAKGATTNAQRVASRMNGARRFMPSP